MTSKWKPKNSGGPSATAGQPNLFQEASKIKLKSTGASKPWMKEAGAANGGNSKSVPESAPAKKPWTSPFSKKKPSVSSTIAARTNAFTNNNNDTSNGTSASSATVPKWKKPSAVGGGTGSSSATSPSWKKKASVFGGGTTTSSTTPSSNGKSSSNTVPSWKKKTFGATTTSTSNPITPPWKKKASVTAASPASPSRSPRLPLWGKKANAASANNNENSNHSDSMNDTSERSIGKKIKNKLKKSTSSKSKKNMNDSFSHNSDSMNDTSERSLGQKIRSRLTGGGNKKSSSSFTPSKKPTITKAPPPAKNSSLLDKSSSGTAALSKLQDAPEQALLDAAMKKLKNKNLSKDVEQLVQRIQKANGFPQRRRLSLRDNDIVTTMNGVIMNDPTITVVDIDNDTRFTHISKSLVLEFAESFRTNLHVKTLSLKGIELDNGFLSAFSTSIESNFTLETINLTNNGFTSDALVDFCQAMGINDTVRKIDIREQISPILTTADEIVMESLRKNKRVEKFRIDVKSSELKSFIKAIAARNKEAQSGAKDSDLDAKLIEHLTKEAERAEELQKQAELASRTLDNDADDDWKYLYELSECANKYKLNAELTDTDGDNNNNNNKPQSFSGGGGGSSSGSGMQSKQDGLQKMLGPTTGSLTADGAFLTNEYISSYLVEDEECGSLTFAYQSQIKLFKRFPIGDSKRKFISEKFADVLVEHPRAKDITHVNMAICGCGDEWLVRFAQRCLKNPKLMPKLHLLNMETNFISEPGVIALAKCIADPDAWKYLQAVRLENQRHLISSRAELELAKALCVNRSVIRLSFRVRNLWEREQINKFVQRNMDYLRQARLRHSIQTGTRVERARNKMEQLFDQVAEDDPAITEVEVVGNQLFLSLPRDEVVKAARAFATNTHVISVRMTMLKLDDKFACELAKSIEKNTVIEKLILDSNSIASEGITAIVASLAKNTSIVELQIRHQSKPLGSAEEEQLIGLLGDNKTLCKLGIDLRGMLPQTQLEKKMAQNREYARKARQNNKTSSSNGGSPLPAIASKQGKMQQLFNKIAKDDPSITEVNLVGDKLFLGMSRDDRLQAAKSFAGNTHVENVHMTMLELDDDFACAFAKSLESNEGIEKLILDSNMISGKGIKAIVASLANHKSVVELQIRHQKKPLARAEEDELPSLFSRNKSLIKIGIDVRSSMVQNEIDKKITKNRDRQREKKSDKKSEKKATRPAKRKVSARKNDSV